MAQSTAFDIPGYELIRELGAGGMATVFLALQRSLDRRVAIKVMRRGLTDENVEKRFLREGRTMAKLPHRNIVSVYDIVQNDEINYIAMEFLDRGTLSERMRDGLSLAEAVSIVVQIAGALDYVHHNGVVHRDLKPANIMFRDAHTPVLTDFGIARQASSEATRLTQTGMMIGTPTYMSPEQATGAAIDGRSDQYSLGVMFYEMLTGAPPFQADTPLSVVLAHLHTPPPPLPPQFAHFQPLLDRLLAKEPAQRYPDLQTFVRELKALLTGSDTLLARLQLEPGQSASEQLRALGFTESQIHSGSVQRFQPQPEETQRRSTGPGVRMEPVARRPPPPAPRTPPIVLWSAGAAVLVVLLVVVFWSLWPRQPSLDPATQGAIATLLRTADRHAQEQRLVAPPEDNAFEVLQQVLQLQPEHREASERLDAIARSLREQAQQALAARNFELAETRLAEARTVRPEATELDALARTLETTRLAAQREARIAELLQRADAARAAGRIFGQGSDDALSLLQQALQIDPDNGAARQRIGQITGEALEDARQQFAAGRLDAAERALEALAGHFAGEPDWQQLKTQIGSARQRAQQQERVRTALARLELQIRAGRLAEPAGDNALETLARVRELDPDSDELTRLARRTAESLASQASAAERGGRLTEALTRYEQALQASPEERSYLQAKQSLQQRVGERQAQLSRLLADAREAITQRRYLAPSAQSAKQRLDDALALDPGNSEARQLLADLPRLILESAQEWAREQRTDDALTMLAEAVRSYPDDTPLAQLQARLVRERDAVKVAETRLQRLAEVQELLARRALNADTARAISAALRELLQANPRDADALALRETFVQGIGRLIGMTEDAAQLELIVPILAQVEAQLGSSADVVSLRSHHGEQTRRVAARDAERLAASQGSLLLNALPWAEVESVVDQVSGREVALPALRATPLRLTLPAGTYRVSFRHPAVGKPVVVIARVEARGEQSASAPFPTLSAADYLRRAGWSSP